MARTFIIKMQSGEEIRAVIDTVPVIVAFERHFNRSALELETAPRYEWVAWTCWFAARNDGAAVPAKFDDFLAALDNEDPLTDAATIGESNEPDAPDPTDGGQ